jgi:hypothetical protein
MSETKVDIPLARIEQLAKDSGLWARPMSRLPTAEEHNNSVVDFATRIALEVVAQNDST